MFCDPRRLTPVALCATLLLAGLACGKKGDPLPPPSKRPAPPEGLVVEQRGDDLVLRFAYPTLTLGGLALPGVEAVEVWRLAKVTLRDERGDPLVLKVRDEAAEAGDEDAEPEWPADLRPEDLDRLTLVGPLALFLVPRPEPPLPTIDAREFAGSAEAWLRIEGEELQRAVVGDRIVLTVSVGEATAGLPEDPLADAALAQGLAVDDLDLDPAKVVQLPTVGLGIVTYSTDGRDSPLGKPAVAVPTTAPVPPAGFDVVPEADGIALSWQAPPGAENAAGYNVYRRSADVRTYLEPILQVPPEVLSVKDGTAVYGERYLYAVTTVARRGPLVESRIASEREIDYQDRFAPPPPRRLVALVETGRVRLLWQAVEAPDLAGYHVYRRLAGAEEAVRIHEAPILEPETVDTEVIPGRRYVYEVRSVDALGNVSEALETAEATAR